MTTPLLLRWSVVVVTLLSLWCARLPNVTSFQSPIPTTTHQVRPNLLGDTTRPLFSPYPTTTHDRRRRRYECRWAKASVKLDDDDDDDEEMESEEEYENEDELETYDDDDDEEYDDEEEEETQVEAAYGKLEVATKMQQDDDNEEEEALPPLPKFLSDYDNDHAASRNTGWSATAAAADKEALDATQRRIEEQQRQIDMLMKLVTMQQTKTIQAPTEELPPLPPPFQDEGEEEEQGESSIGFKSSEFSSPGNNVAPLKAMLFIDGTWLYYSIYERNEQQCPIVQKYGRAWQSRYSFDWAALPRVICEQMQHQQMQLGWSSPGGKDSSPRPVEIVRASVFTSCKKDTSKYSNRIRMYEDMGNANYDVYMMETVGPGEKCVDIQLAVEMLHYATVPNAYDVAILLSGDKDFMPAMVRTRQKGRKVGIVSMRAGCNRALVETPNVKDYDVVWIEDFLDRLMIPKSDGVPDDNHMQVSVFTMMKVIYDFIHNSGLKRVSSRDIGRYLKSIKIAGRSLLDELKEAYGGLYQFLTVSGCFEVQKRNEAEARKMDSRDKSFWASVHSDSEKVLLEEAKVTQFSVEEKKFFDNYSKQSLYDHDDEPFLHSKPADSRGGSPHTMVMVNAVKDEPMDLPEELTRDYSTCTVAELKTICRERGLLVSGTKAVLIERVQNDVENSIAERKKAEKEKRPMKRPRITGRINGDGHAVAAPNIPFQPPPNSAASAKHLEGLVREYIQASGGSASSRDVGRYLAANSGSGVSAHGRTTALSELKKLYGGLAAFITSRQDAFLREDNDADPNASFAFRIKLRKQ